MTKRKYTWEPRPATGPQKRILRRAAKQEDGRLIHHPEIDPRLWMYQLTQMSKKGYIHREKMVAYITDVGRAILEIEGPVKRRRAGPALFGVRGGESALSEVTS